MQPIATLSDFFDRSGAEVRLYHMGRRIAPCTPDVLATFEQGDRSWPAPWQGEARLACVFRLHPEQEPMIWFLALPLDEQGQLSAAPRDAFVQRLLETLGRSAERLASTPQAGSIDNLMKDNPLAFTPSLPLQAMLHARASADLDAPASQHHELAEEYLTGEHDHDWQALGLQGLADVAVRHDAALAERLAARLDDLPNEVLHPLCYCLEHLALTPSLAAALCRRGERAAEVGDLETLCACVRAVGASQAVTPAWYSDLLDDPAACGPDLLAAMAARGWEHLEDPERLPLFLTRLAEHPQAEFSALARDLALIPRLRLPVLMTLRQADPGSAIGRRLSGLTDQR
ncbi:Protein of unknown function [Franzmannia pantelleriensis]|uniref:DUF3549 domain-containing protein n=1 Tax=Franzmannia pantelleriensis TaxID=48727 RepID=A0A1G9H3M9_9GAMM|nr:DUF3549 family protein [Halomonas pantelleriensis]SDL07566.1 Protein of unknown function [Halomonas pantelleriensis]